MHNCLLEDSAGFCFLQSAFFQNVLKQITILAILHHNIYIPIVASPIRVSDIYPFVSFPVPVPVVRRGRRVGCGWARRGYTQGEVVPVPVLHHGRRVGLGEARHLCRRQPDQAADGGGNATASGGAVLSIKRRQSLTMPATPVHTGTCHSNSAPDGTRISGRFWAIEEEDEGEEVITTPTTEEFIAAAARVRFTIENLIQAENEIESSEKVTHSFHVVLISDALCQAKSSTQLHEKDHLSVMGNHGKASCQNKGCLHQKH
jgi:hypothetical protein